MKTVVIDPEGKVCIIVDTGAGVSCRGPDCAFFVEPAEPPSLLRLMGANDTPLGVEKVGEFRLIFGWPDCYVIGTLFVAADYEEQLPAPVMDLARVYIVKGAVHAFVADVASPQVIEPPQIEADERNRSDGRQENSSVTQPFHDVSNARNVSSPRTATPGVRTSLALTRRFSPGSDGYTFSVLFQDEVPNEVPHQC